MLQENQKLVSPISCIVLLVLGIFLIPNLLWEHHIARENFIEVIGFDPPTSFEEHIALRPLVETQIDIFEAEYAKYCELAKEDKILSEERKSLSADRRIFRIRMDAACTRLQLARRAVKYFGF